MAKAKICFVCSACGYKSVKWLGRCTSCGSFNTMEEQFESKIASQSASHAYAAGDKPSAAMSISSISTEEEERVPTGIGELDRVLSGGFVTGSLTLAAGEPGVGKSTLILQICQKLGEYGKTILYASGEESVRQIKMRAQRLCVETDNLYILSETNMDSVLRSLDSLKADFLIVDSIQTMMSDDIPNTPGSVTQVRECTGILMKLAKSRGVSVIIVGHSTKDGNIAGPRILEHMVDTVLYFEGERHLNYRLIRAVKNRFGTTNEIGMFEMRDTGLAEITNPSEYMLSGRPRNVSGSIVTATVEGTRPILTEAQALVTPTAFGMPRRMASGADLNRVNMITAAIEKRAGIRLSDQDIYINVSGGIKITEPALDAAVAAAIVSSHKNKIIDHKTMIFGETGLSGEIRAVSHMEKRVAEGAKLGFETCIMPEAGLKSIKCPDGVKLYGIRNLIELIEIL